MKKHVKYFIIRCALCNQSKPQAFHKCFKSNCMELDNHSYVVIEVCIQFIEVIEVYIQFIEVYIHTSLKTIVHRNHSKDIPIPNWSGSGASSVLNLGYFLKVGT